MEIQKFDIGTFSEGVLSKNSDELIAGEIPVTINVRASGEEQTLVTTLCTPCDLKQMILGFLFSEGLIEKATDIKIAFNKANAFQAQVQFSQNVDWKKSVRSFVQHGGCGLCSKTVLERISKPIQGLDKVLKKQLLIPENIISFYQSPLLNQPLFSATGATHAAALFDLNGAVMIIYEDVGRHNAVDKVVGHALQNDWGMHDKVLWVSGRAGFELVQKAVNANFAAMLSVGAPTSMALELAAATGLILIGFFKGKRKNKDYSYNIYNE